MIQHYSKARLMKMFSIVNPELLEKYYNEGRHVIVMGGHYNNWEWSSPFSYTYKQKVIGVYKPLHNSYFDKAYKRSRSRFGADIVPMGGIVKKLYEYSSKKISYNNRHGSRSASCEEADTILDQFSKPKDSNV